MQKQWHFKMKATPEETESICSLLKITPVMAQLCWQRGLTTEKKIRSYFKTKIEELHDPFLMKNMEKAVERLHLAIVNKEKILVFGDYDVDGTSSVALVSACLKDYSKIETYIPDRYKEGYGLSYDAIEFAKINKISLIITLDCGIKEIEKIAFAKTIGIDTIVCDHHTPGSIVPEGIILDPKQQDCPYPYKELCGCGVAYKFMSAYFNRYRKDSISILEQQLDLVALATGADIVPITGENRILAKIGLSILNKQERIGIKQLVHFAARNYPLTLTDVVFIVAPRINAAGRLSTGNKAVSLLLSNNEDEAKSIAKEINEHNINRRYLDSQITEEALEQVSRQISNEEESVSTIVFDETWHKGVIGIVASRLIEKHYRPTVVFTQHEGNAVGSARSVPGLNIYDAIDSCKEEVVQFGGHAFAAGLTVEISKMESFKRKLNNYISLNWDHAKRIEKVNIDLEVNFSDLFVNAEGPDQNTRLLQFLENLEPFGPENMRPVFCIKNIYTTNHNIMKDIHVKLNCFDPISGISLSAVGFNMAKHEDIWTNGMAYDMVFSLEKNVFRNKTSVQLMIKDLRAS